MTQLTQKSAFEQHIDLVVNKMIANANPAQLKTAVEVTVLLKNKDLITTILSHPHAAKIEAQNLTDAIKSAQAKQ
jgi:hypothetical protein